MRILDETSNKSLSNLTLLLEKAEAIQLIGYLEELLAGEEKNIHFHLNNSDYTKEITLSIYDSIDVGGFAERYKKLIFKDE